MKEHKRKRQKACTAKKREEDNAEVKEHQRKRQKACMAKKREDDNAEVKEHQRKRQKACMAKKRNHDNGQVKKDQAKRSRLCLNKKRLEDPENVKANQNERQQRHREVKTKSDRLKEFREATKHAAVFICTCCQQRMFHANVQLYTDTLQKDINAKKSGHTEACVEREIETSLNGETKVYICKTCVRHKRNKKLPPMSAKSDRAPKGWSSMGGLAKRRQTATDGADGTADSVPENRYEIGRILFSRALVDS